MFLFNRKEIVLYANPLRFLHLIQKFKLGKNKNVSELLFLFNRKDASNLKDLRHPPQIFAYDIFEYASTRKWYLSAIKAAILAASLEYGFTRAT